MLQVILETIFPANLTGTVKPVAG